MKIICALILQNEVKLYHVFSAVMYTNLHLLVCNVKKSRNHVINDISEVQAKILPRRTIIPHHLHIQLKQETTKQTGQNIKPL